LKSEELSLRTNAVYEEAIYLIMKTREALANTVPVSGRRHQKTIPSAGRVQSLSPMDQKLTAILGAEYFFAYSLARWTKDLSSNQVLDLVTEKPIPIEDRERRKAIVRLVNTVGWSHEANVLIGSCLEKNHFVIRELKSLV
jgi:hypothetical protein